MKVKSVHHKVVYPVPSWGGPNVTIQIPFIMREPLLDIDEISGIIYIGMWCLSKNTPYWIS